MWKRLSQAVGGLALVLIALWVVFAIAMRTKFPPVVNAIRMFNRGVTNPRAMETAGQPGAYAGVIQHVGRNSGAAYETPIGPFRTDDGFVVPLPYGSSPDWLKNVRAQGSAVIVHEGETYQVDRPELIGSEAAMVHVPPKYQWTLRLYSVDEFLRVRMSDADKGRDDDEADGVDAGD